MKTILEFRKNQIMNATLARKISKNPLLHEVYETVKNAALEGKRKIAYDDDYLNEQVIKQLKLDGFKVKFVKDAWQYDTANVFVISW